MTIFGARPGSAGDHRPRGREAERILATELLDAFRNFAQTQTEFAERLQGRLVNHVLEVGTHIFDGSGVLPRQWHAAAGVVEVANLSEAGTVTVTSTGPADSPPASGTGVYRVPPGAVRTIAVGSRQVTLYGAAGDVVTLQAFTAAPAPVV